MDHSARTPASRGDEIWTATGHEPPVFLDEHGRRRRWVLLGGSLAGGFSAAWLGALVAGAIGFSTMPSVQAHAPLLASAPTLVATRTAAGSRRHVLPSGSHRRSKGSHAERSSSLERATELAVSRGLSGS